MTRDLAAEMAQLLTARHVNLSDEAAVVMMLAWSGFRIQEIGDNLDAVLAAARRERANAEHKLASAGAAS